MAVAPAGYPADGLPEVALLGRSNVGKSSLVNRLVNRKRLARTSSTPGKTRTINFYRVDRRLYLVDLPGYGYARAGRRESQSWQRMIDEYLRRSGGLRGLIQLVDVRHPPSELDRRVAFWLGQAGLPRAVAAVKADKIARSRRAPAAAAIRRELELAAGTPVVPFSAVDGTGVGELWEVILGLAAGSGPAGGLEGWGEGTGEDGVEDGAADDAEDGAGRGPGAGS